MGFSIYLVRPEANTFSRSPSIAHDVKATMGGFEKDFKCGLFKSAGDTEIVPCGGNAIFLPPDREIINRWLILFLIVGNTLTFHKTLYSHLLFNL